MAVAGVAGKPLRLKDFLELDCDSCSAAGFRCYPRRLCVAGAPSLPMRHLQLEAAEEPRGFGRSPSLRRPKLSHLSRSLSRRLWGGFSWRRREEEAAAACSPEVAVSRRGSSSDSETSVSGSSTERKSESDFSSASSESPHAAAAAAGDEHEVMKGGSNKEAGCGSEADDGEQLSPVAVMDFPFEDDDDDVVPEEGRRDGGGACSPSFGDSLAQLQTRKMQLQHKIRRFGSIGEPGAVDLEERFAASESDGHGRVPVQQQLQCCCTDATTAPPRPDDGHRSVDVYQEPDEHSLLGLVTGTVSAVGVDGVSERLLLDFLAETRKLRTSKDAVRLARDWLEGTGARWGLKDVLCRREDLMADMERSQRWSARVGEVEEECEASVVVAGMVIDELVGELIRDLLV